MISPELREFAESPEAYLVLPPGFQRVQNERFSVLLGPIPQFTSVQRVRIEPDAMAATLEEVRALIAGHDHVEGTWWFSDESLWERLRSLGLKEPRNGESELTALALAEPPGAGPADVTAGPAETLEDYVKAVELRRDVFDEPRMGRRPGRGLQAGSRGGDRRDLRRAPRRQGGRHRDGRLLRARRARLRRRHGTLGTRPRRLPGAGASPLG